MASSTICQQPDCGAVVTRGATICPTCGQPVQPLPQSPAPGWILLVLGPLLVAMIGTVTWALWPTLVDPAGAIDRGEFSGTVEQAETIALLFAGIILFGLVCTANGLRWVITGRQSRVFMVLTLGLATGLVLIGWMFMRTAK